MKYFSSVFGFYFFWGFSSLFPSVILHSARANFEPLVSSEGTEGFKEVIVAFKCDVPSTALADFNLCDVCFIKLDVPALITKISKTLANMEETKYLVALSYTF